MRGNAMRLYPRQDFIGATAENWWTAGRLWATDSPSHIAMFTQVRPLNERATKLAVNGCYLCMNTGRPGMNTWRRWRLSQRKPTNLNNEMTTPKVVEAEGY